jgi:hypothetical protein
MVPFLLFALLLMFFAAALHVMTSERIHDFSLYASVIPSDERGYSGPLRLRHHGEAPARRGVFSFHVRGTCPSRVYEGDSHNISITLEPCQPSSDPVPHDGHSDAGLGAWNIPEDVLVSQTLDVEIEAAGFNIAGEKRLHRPLTFQRLSFVWNCYFPNSGTHAFVLKTTVNVRGGSVQVGSLEYTVKVVRFWILTKRQVWVAQRIAALTSGLVAAVGVLYTCGVL